MNTLQKALRYSVNTKTSAAEITAFANELLAVTWEMRASRTLRTNFNLKDLGWGFEFNTRKGSIGLCSTRNKKISISKNWFATNMDKSHDWEDTLRHEVAHALDIEIRGTSDHSEIWKDVARQVLCDATRTTGAFEKGDSKYLIVCPNCDKKQAAHKKRSPTSACGECCKKYNGNRFSPKYIYKLVVNPTYNQVKPEVSKPEVIKPTVTEAISTPTIDSKLSRQQQVEKLLSDGITDRKQISEMLGLNYSYLTRLLKIIENSKA
jgi:predicted SprT family Zn-dependent metalloprotease